ncbi:MAG: hypothetical protein HQ517_14190 [SAR324 cluster bacterium]|nr:hypothetical protein [SAR324 cluster bacterium]
MKNNSRLFWTEMETRLFKLLVITGIFLFSGLNLHAYDFSDARKTMHNDLASSNNTGLNRRLAIIYDIQDHDNVKKQTNLVNFKKDLSLELLKSFEVVDPIIVQKVMTTNNLTFNQITSNTSILKQFADRAQSSQILLVELRLQEDYLQTRLKLINNRHEQISDIKMQLAFEQERGAPYQTARVVTQSSAPHKSVFESFSSDFSPQSFIEGQNDSWIYFSPTAEIMPNLQSIDLLLWMKNLAEVDIRPARLRYDLRLFEVLQLGFQVNAIVEKKNAKKTPPNSNTEQGFHSTYMSLKYQLSDGSKIPVSVVFGVRRRLLWDTDNNDFKTSDLDEVNDKNDRYNQLTLLAAATGKVEQLGLLYNVYLDSQTVGMGAKFLLTSEIKLFADAVLYYHQDPQIASDTAFGAQLYNPAGAISLSYQISTEQVQLGFVFDF